MVFINGAIAKNATSCMCCLCYRPRFRRRTARRHKSELSDKNERRVCEHCKRLFWSILGHEVFGLARSEMFRVVHTAAMIIRHAQNRALAAQPVGMEIAAPQELIDEFASHERPTGDPTLRAIWERKDSARHARALAQLTQLRSPRAHAKAELLEYDRRRKAWSRCKKRYAQTGVLPEEPKYVFGSPSKMKSTSEMIEGIRDRLRDIVESQAIPNKADAALRQIVLDSNVDVASRPPPPVPGGLRHPPGHG